MIKTFSKIGILLGILGVTSIAGAATISVSPASGTYASGSTFTVNVQLDTEGANIDGVDVRYLKFNPSVLQVVDSNSSQNGIQVSPGALMPSTLTNTVNNSSGTITFSQIVAGGQHYQGSGNLFTVTFQVVSGGTATLSFDAISGMTTDSNVAANGKDVLSSASGATFTLSGNVVASPNPITPQPSPYPTPTPTATPTPGSSGIGGINLYRTILIGSSGSDVTTLQNYLIANGYLAAGLNSGYFGALTQAAVRKFQCAKMNICSGNEGTTGYGMVGARTRAVLAGGSVSPTPTPTPSTPGTYVLTKTIYFGLSGADVTTLQNFLIDRGYLAAGNNTGYFGSLTRGAVQKFQCAKMSICSGSESSTGYGMVGARTRAAIQAN